MSTSQHDYEEFVPIQINDETKADAEESPVFAEAEIQQDSKAISIPETDESMISRNNDGAIIDEPNKDECEQTIEVQEREGLDVLVSEPQEVSSPNNPLEPDAIPVSDDEEEDGMTQQANGDGQQDLKVPDNVILYIRLLCIFY
jgi:hypothetical protein